MLHCARSRLPPALFVLTLAALAHAELYWPQHGHVESLAGEAGSAANSLAQSGQTNSSPPGIPADTVMFTVAFRQQVRLVGGVNKTATARLASGILGKMRVQYEPGLRYRVRMRGGRRRFLLPEHVGLSIAEASSGGCRPWPECRRECRKPQSTEFASSPAAISAIRNF